MNNIEIKKETVFSAYKSANREQKELLEHMFGSDMFKQLDIRNRIKTFDDALVELHERIDNGDNHAKMLVDEYEYNNHNTVSCDLLAYCKLRIIAEALNEGWRPEFTQNERRWYPYFRLCTKEEFDNNTYDSPSRVIGRGGNYASAYYGLVYANADYASSYASTSVGSRLAFKNNELAEYAGQQFIDVYADYYFNPLNI